MERMVFLNVEEQVTFLPTGLLITPRMLLCLLGFDPYVAAHKEWRYVANQYRYKYYVSGHYPSSCLYLKSSPRLFLIIFISKYRYSQASMRKKKSARGLVELNHATNSATSGDIKKHIWL
jgi:hypothetical protein